MTTNRMGLEQTLSDERLEEVANIGSIEKMQCAAMARELLAYRKASKEPIGEVCLGEYDDSGSHPDARVVCLHSHADWDNFANGFKLFAAPPLQDVTVPDESAIFEAAIDMCRKSDSINEHAWNHGVLAVMSAFRGCSASMLKGESK